MSIVVFRRGRHQPALLKLFKLLKEAEEGKDSLHGLPASDAWNKLWAAKIFVSPRQDGVGFQTWSNRYPGQDLVSKQKVCIFSVGWINIKWFLKCALHYQLDKIPSFPHPELTAKKYQYVKLSLLHIMTVIGELPSTAIYPFRASAVARISLSALHRTPANDFTTVN